MEVAVLGATEDGRALAGRCGLVGHSVHLHDADANVVMDSIDAIEATYGSNAVEAIDGTTGLEAAVNDAAVIVVATDGDDGQRRELVADVEELAADDALLATSGATASVTAVAAGLLRPGRAVGLHLVTPGETDVVEVVVADQTTESARERAVSFVEGIDSTPLVVYDAPGFASARLDLALIVEATSMVEEGVASVADIDQALELGRGHPTGPLALADELGLDHVLAALEDLANRLDGRFEPPGLLHEKVNNGNLGVTTGTGFYEWENGERVEPADPDLAVRGRPDPQSGPGGSGATGRGGVPGTDDE